LKKPDNVSDDWKEILETSRRARKLFSEKRTKTAEKFGFMPTANFKKHFNE
jgi:hypothetical protein